MRAVIAETFGGHPFEDKYLNMPETQVFILFRYIMNERKTKQETQHHLIKEVIDVTFKQFKYFFDEVLLFINHKMFKSKIDLEAQLKNRKEHPPEITPENFEEIWGELEKVIPMEYVVEELDPLEHLLENKADPELDEMIAGWIQKSNNVKK